MYKIHDCVIGSKSLLFSKLCWRTHVHVWIRYRHTFNSKIHACTCFLYCNLNNVYNNVLYIIYLSSKKHKFFHVPSTFFYSPSTNPDSDDINTARVAECFQLGFILMRWCCSNCGDKGSIARVIPSKRIVEVAVRWNHKQNCCQRRPFECLCSVNQPCTGKDCCTGMFPVSCTVQCL